MAAGRASSNPGESSNAPAVEDTAELERATATTRQARSDDFDSPGTRFQTFVLLNYRCPVVRPLCFLLVPPVDLWISQSNGGSSAPPALVSNALSYHFCGPLEAFRVTPCSAFLFSISVATESVKNHLCRIGVIAIQGIIFHLHPDAAAARSFLDFLRRPGNGVPISKFESSTVAFSDNGQSPRPIPAPQPSLGNGALGAEQPNVTLKPGQEVGNLGAFAQSIFSAPVSGRFDSCHQPDGPSPMHSLIEDIPIPHFPRINAETSHRPLPPLSTTTVGAATAVKILTTDGEQGADSPPAHDWNRPPALHLTSPVQFEAPRYHAYRGYEMAGAQLNGMIKH
ncbi:unnamed protein product [Miscanthus lutarioriparius]|uniref:Uncharacterized protein n=1 Tax=Miscanthus lutarioriparius TaxID=422564 RepID=A0A811MUH2_9POAL|nr:unnamed protein product [Miscanthus lutarioriparius]